MCASLTDSHTEGQDDWWLLPTPWTGETLSADNEAKEKGLPFIWLYTLTTHNEQEHCTGDSFKLCLHRGTVWALDSTKSVTTEFKGTFLYAPACFHIVMNQHSALLKLCDVKTFWSATRSLLEVSDLSNYIRNSIVTVTLSVCIILQMKRTSLWAAAFLPEVHQSNGPYSDSLFSLWEIGTFSISTALNPPLSYLLWSVCFLHVLSTDQCSDLWNDRSPATGSLSNTAKADRLPFVPFREAVINHIHHPSLSIRPPTIVHLLAPTTDRWSSAI